MKNIVEFLSTKVNAKIAFNKLNDFLEKLGCKCLKHTNDTIEYDASFDFITIYRRWFPINKEQLEERCKELDDNNIGDEYTELSIKRDPLWSQLELKMHVNDHIMGKFSLYIGQRDGKLTITNFEDKGLEYFYNIIQYILTNESYN